MNWQIVLTMMLLGHLVSDYTLQGWLADGKQKSWWDKAFGGKTPAKYRFDYVAALLCHALYWSIFICAPFYASRFFILAILYNAVVHAEIDDLKANRNAINLVTDQCLHLAQILVTFAILV